MAGLPNRNAKESPDFLREIVEHLSVGFYVMNDAGQFTDANPTFLKMFGLPGLKELKSLDAGALLKFTLSDLQLDLLHRERIVREFEPDIKRADGRSTRMLHVLGVPSIINGSPKLYEGLVVDITELPAPSDPLQDRSFRDTLTGAYNRFFLAEFEKQASAPEKAWGCLFIYIDHFKQYNDRYGADAGEEALQKMSRFLMRHARARDAVVRISDDEFVVLIEDGDAVHTGRIARRLRTAALGQAPVPFSLGWAVRETAETLEKTIIRADSNLAPVRVLFRTPTRRKSVTS